MKKIILCLFLFTTISVGGKLICEDSHGTIEMESSIIHKSEEPSHSENNHCHNEGCQDTIIQEPVNIAINTKQILNDNELTYCQLEKSITELNFFKNCRQLATIQKTDTIGLSILNTQSIILIC